MWDEPSVVARCKQRLTKADLDLKTAEAAWVSCKREWSLINAYIKFEKRAQTMPEFLVFKRRATVKLAAFYEDKKSSENVVVCEFPSLAGPPSYLDVCAVRFGLAQTWALGNFADW